MSIVDFENVEVTIDKTQASDTTKRILLGENP